MPPEQSNANGELQVDPHGTVHVPPFALPLSAALSDHSRAFMAAALSRSPRIVIPRAKDFTTEADFKAMADGFRANVDMAFARPLSERLLDAFPVNITAGRLGGVSVEEFTPLDGLDSARVLINLHGGGFFAGATYVSRAESIPIANLSKIRVVSVDYRQGYEHKFPAASEDICAVYKELLKSFAPTQIGICGGSAGGVLTAQGTAWILRFDEHYAAPRGSAGPRPSSVRRRLTSPQRRYSSHARASPARNRPPPASRRAPRSGQNESCRCDRRPGPRVRDRQMSLSERWCS